MSGGQVERGSAVPFYAQLKALLVADLESGRLQPGDRLPGEHDLCRRFGVSRTVVRQALGELEAEGRLRRRKGRGTFAKESRALAEKVRDGKISPPELSGATFSITNLGMYGVTTFTAVINPPQAAILAVGKMEPKPVVRDGELTVRNGMNVTIACDHRILSGAPAAEFLARVKAILEQPIALAL